MTCHVVVVAIVVVVVVVVVAVISVIFVVSGRSASPLAPKYQQCDLSKEFNPLI